MNKWECERWQKEMLRGWGRVSNPRALLMERIIACFLQLCDEKFIPRDEALRVSIDPHRPLCLPAPGGRGDGTHTSLAG